MKVGKIFEKISRYTKSPRALVLVGPLSSSCGPFLPWNVLVASAKGSDVFESQTCRRRETGGPHGPCNVPGPPQTGDPVAPPLCVSFHSQGLPPTGTLWNSARAELEAFVGVMILIEADWARPWFPCVLASDASLSGCE